MALAIVLVDAAWNAVGLAGRGLVLTGVQIAVEVIIGAGVFLAVATALKMGEVRTLMGLVLRRPQALAEQGA
jgi:hypothetical protein